MTQHKKAINVTNQRGGEPGPVRTALISCNEDFWAKVNRLVGVTDGRVEIGVETDATSDVLLGEPDTPLRDYDPQLLFLELGPAEPVNDNGTLYGIN